MHSTCWIYLDNKYNDCYLTWSNRNFCGVFINDLDFVREAVPLRDGSGSLCHGLKHLCGIHIFVFSQIPSY